MRFIILSIITLFTFLSPSPNFNNPRALGLEKIYMTAAIRRGVPPVLLRAMCKLESNHNPGARGRAGEIGLCQIMPATARLACRLEPRELWNPAVNADCAALYLARQKRKFGDWEKALMAYNIGPGNLERGTALKRGRRYTRLVFGHVRNILLTGGDIPGENTHTAGR